jgi:hypothetical protein
MVSLAFSTVGLYKPQFDKYSFYYISHPSYTVCVTSLETSCTGLVVQASDIEDIFHTWHTCMTWCILAPLHVQRDCLDSDANVVSYLHSVQCNRTFEASLKLISLTVLHLIACTIIAEKFELWTFPLCCFFFNFPPVSSWGRASA